MASAELDEMFSEARVLVRQLEQGPPFDAPIELRLYGPNVDRLAEIGNEARALELKALAHNKVAELGEAQSAIQ